MIASNKTFDFMRDTLCNKQRFVSNAMLFKEASCEQNLSDRETINILKNIIDNLSGREKIIISLNLLEAKTHKEISGILGMPINTISTIIARTKEKIKKELEKYGIIGQAV